MGVYIVIVIILLNLSSVTNLVRGELYSMFLVY
jgi:hypothetical protein